MLSSEGCDPATGRVLLHDRGVKRWARGFSPHRWYLNLWHIIYAGGALAVSGLGASTACEVLVAAFANPQINAFSCRSPLNLTPA